MPINKSKSNLKQLKKHLPFKNNGMAEYKKSSNSTLLISRSEPPY